MKFLKRAVCLLCLALLCLYLFPLGGTTSAKEYTENVQWHYKEGLLTIQGTGYVSGGSPAVPWDKYRDRITEIVIAPGITGLGNGLFRDCTALTKVTLPDGLTQIGIECFSGCNNLAAIDFPDSLKRIDRKAFMGCSKLTSITIPSAMDTICSEAFAKCDALKTVHISSIATWLSITFEDHTACPLYDGAQLLLDGKPLTEVTIPDGVKAVGSFAFYGCKDLRTMVLPDGITHISAMAFAGCENLTSVSVPGSLQYIGSNAFLDCSSLEHIIFRGNMWQLAKLRVYASGDDTLQQASWSIAQPYLTRSLLILHLIQFLMYAVPAAVIIIIAKKTGRF